jgi:dTDP-4-amino-4,6-dideoxygalactose transaminase
LIPVTKSFLPPLEDYNDLIKRVYENAWLTNRGELVKELELELSAFLKLQDSRILLTNNGTIPLQIALKLMGDGGEIITTPFSYVATTASIVWENCKPVFVDIDPEYLTIDDTKIEAAITEETTCILATHVFGNPCNIEAIQRIAAKHQLKVIYDAAHCFGVKYNGKSIFEYGDLSTCSFHATKLFHTGEGGAAFCKDEDLFDKVFYSHNFGHDGPLAFHGLGINGKMSELHAAMGLSIVPYIKKILTSREELVKQYDQKLNFEKLSRLKIRQGTEWNFSYYPVLFESERALLKVEGSLNQEGIYPRRYFYPSLNKLPYIEKQNCFVSEAIASRILCLPLYYGLKEKELDSVVNLINENL